METEASKIGKLVERLVARSVPPQRARGVCKFAMRVLGSRIEPSSCKDEFEVSARIKKRILKAGAPKRGAGRADGEGGQVLASSGYSTALRFDELFRKLCASRTLQQRWAILHLLASLGDTADDGSSGAFRALDTLDLNAGRALHPPAPTNSSSSSSSSSGGSGAPPPPAATAAAAAADAVTTAQRLIYGHTPAAELTNKTSFEVSEHALIRDCLYAFQGINAEYVQRGGGDVGGGGSGSGLGGRFGDCYQVRPGVGAPGATRDLLSCCCELGWLYTRVAAFVALALDNPSLGMCGQALVHAVQEELTDYYRLVAVLEAHLAGKQQLGGGGALTLRRLAVWVAEPMERMRLLATVCDSAAGLRGGALASSLRAYARHGDPFVAQFVGSLVTRVSAPLFWMIRCWVLEGTLEDLHQEFFIVSDPAVAEVRWAEKYRLDLRMLPSFLSPELAGQILRIGKSINFVARCCDDSEWVQREAAARLPAAVADGAFAFGQTARLEAAIAGLATTTNRRLVQVLMEKFRLLEHLRALKRYLLLGQGDFIAHLMDVLAPELSKPGSSLHRHNLVGVLDAALRSSNAQFEDQGILEQLDFRLLEPSPGETGWDIFSLDYRVATPLDVVVTPAAMHRYLQVFNFLWRLKRVEHTLGEDWKRARMRSVRANAVMRAAPEFRAVLHRCQMLRSEMFHFVSNLHSYMMFEVLETAWSSCEASMRAAIDLDQLLAAHDAYLSSIVEKVSLLASAYIRHECPLTSCPHLCTCPLPPAPCPHRVRFHGR